MMAILNNAFANASSSLIQAKMMGLTPDFLTPPLSPLEQTWPLRWARRRAASWSGGHRHRHRRAAGRGPGRRPHLADPVFRRRRVVDPGLAGILAGLWAEKFDQLAAVTNFLIMPMTFLSGTFYLVDRLPEPFRSASHFNPFFYLIDGFRYGFIGHADGSILIGALATAGLTVALFLWCWHLFRTGYRLKT
jgi:ABC-2 type transport system permease protein